MEAELSTESRARPARQILLVVASSFLRAHLATSLRSGGYAVRTAEGVEAALPLLLRGAPDLVVLDLELSDIPGGSAVDVLMSASSGRGLRFVVMASEPSVADGHARRRPEVLGGLQKPVSGDRLLHWLWVHRHLLDRPARVPRPARLGICGPGEPRLPHQPG